MAALAESVLICSIQTAMAAKSGLLPTKREYSFPTKQQILAVWEIGWDIFIVGLGNRLFYTSQSFLLARFAGLDSVAAWIIGSKLFYFGREILSKAAFMAGPPLMSLYVEGLRDKTELRLSQISKVLGYCAAILGGFLIVGNSAFVELWSGGKVSWPKNSNIALAALLVCNAFSFSLIHLLGMELRFKTLRYLTFLEAIFFTLSSCYFVPRLGLSIVAPLMLLFTLLFSMPYLFYSYIRCCREWQTSRTLHISFVLRLILLLCFASFSTFLYSEFHLSFLAFLSIFVLLLGGLYFIWLDLRFEFAFLKNHFSSAISK
jgi:O-antigen/teichoic acid export membrane protein